MGDLNSPNPRLTKQTSVSNRGRLILLLLLLLITVAVISSILAGGGIYLWQQQAYNRLLKQSSQMVSDTIEASQKLIEEREAAAQNFDPAIFEIESASDFKTFRNKNYGISFNFPKTWSHKIDGIERDADRLTYYVWLCPPAEPDCGQKHSLIFSVSPTDALPVDEFLEDSEKEIATATGRWHITYWRGGGWLGFEDPNADSAGQRGVTSGFFPTEQEVKYVYIGVEAFFPETERSEFETAVDTIINSFSYTPKSKEDNPI